MQLLCSRFDRHSNRAHSPNQGRETEGLSAIVPIARYEFVKKSIARQSLEDPPMLSGLVIRCTWAFRKPGGGGNMAPEAFPRHKTQRNTPRETFPRPKRRC